LRWLSRSSRNRKSRIQRPRSSFTERCTNSGGRLGRPLWEIAEGNLSLEADSRQRLHLDPARIQPCGRTARWEGCGLPLQRWQEPNYRSESPFRAWIWDAVRMIYADDALKPPSGRYRCSIKLQRSPSVRYKLYIDLYRTANGRPSGVFLPHAPRGGDS
jgi:hypothetical protein